MTTVAFTLNGGPVRVETPPGRRLSDVLREDLRLTGTKIGCDAGDCGACTVHLDGRPVCACLTPVAQAEGRAVTTVEGLAAVHSRLQAAFLRHNAAQCGICTPGMLMAAAALLREIPRPTEAQAREALGGVLCRCTGYGRIIAAVCDAWQDGAPVLPGRAGDRGARLDGAAKVDGTDSFGADFWPEGALVLKALRSPHDRARFGFGDLAAFAARPGVAGVWTAADIPGVNRYGVIPALADQPALAETETRHRGEAVALVAFEPWADPDLSGLPVTWEALPALTSAADAEAAGAPLVHETRNGNRLIEGLVRRGDARAGLAASRHLVTGTMTTGFVEHAPIEPEAGAAWIEGDTLVIRACTQAPGMDREETAKVLGLPLDRVRIVPSAVGGGFGTKLDLSLQPLLGLAALGTGRPVRMTFSRWESMVATTKRHPAEIALSIGCDETGRLTALDFRGRFDTGAYASWGPTVASRVPVHATGPYRIPDVEARARAIHTNNPVSGAFRGFGVPQGALALECALDRLADAAGIDRLDFRRRNALADGDATATGQVLRATGIGPCLDALAVPWSRARAEAAAWNANAAPAPLRRGVGLASCWYGCGNTGLPNPSTIRAGITAGGRIVLHQGATDIGQGSNTVIAQIFAEALGVPVAALDLVGPDTGLTPDAGKTSASRQTYVTGRAAQAAGASLRAAILRLANAGEGARIAICQGATPGPAPGASLRAAILRLANAGEGARIAICQGATPGPAPGATQGRAKGTITVTEGSRRQRLDLGVLPLDTRGYVLSAEESYDPPTTALDADGQGAPYAVYGWGAQMVELAVDLRLGTVRLLHITAAHDVGRAINPALCEGQIEGGIAQGIGLALIEEYVPHRSENLHDYLIPTTGDVPPVTPILVEIADPEGPFGAKGLGEHVLIPTAPAILNAIRDATGAEIDRVPALPHRLLAAIRKPRP